MTPDAITQTAFATGRLLHEGTGKPPVGAVKFTAAEGPVVGKLHEDGTFAISAYLNFLFPNLASQNYPFTLTVSLTSPQYRSGKFERTLAPVVVPVGTDFDPAPPAAPDPLIDFGTILLAADPVNIRGRVVEAANPATPVVGATVEVLHAGPPVPNAGAGADGRYRFDDIGVTAPAQIRCSAPTFKTVTRDLLLDFGRLVNEENFRLPPV